MLMEKYGIDIRKPENWARIKEHEAAIIEKDGYGEIPGIRQMILDLRAHGVKLAVASSSYYDLIVKTTKAIGLYDYFDKIRQRCRCGAPEAGTGCVFESHGVAGCAAGGMRHRGGFLQRRACGQGGGAGVSGIL